MVTITEWMCPTPGCGHKLASRVVVRSGWLERKCPQCDAIIHVGDFRGNGPTRWLKCERAPVCIRKQAEVSADWKGEIACKCRRCRSEMTLAA